MKKARKLGMIMPAAKLSYFVLFPGCEPKYDFISSYSQWKIDYEQSIYQKAFQITMKNSAACNWISPNTLQDESWAHPAHRNTHFHPKSKSWTPDPQQHFYMHQVLKVPWNFRYSESSYCSDTEGLSESSDSTQENTIPPCRHLPKLWWESTVKQGGKKADFHHFSRSKSMALPPNMQ